MLDFLKSKPVLYGGAAVAALLAYMYFRNSGGDGTDQGAVSQSSYPYDIVYGMGGTSIADVQSSGAGNTANTGLNAGDQALIDLQMHQLELQGVTANNNYNLSVLQSTQQYETDLANIAATREYNKQSLNAQELDTVAKTFLKTGGQGLAASVNGETISLAKINPPPQPAVGPTNNFLSLFLPKAA